MLRTVGVAPVDSGISQLVLQNEGEAPGRLAIAAITVESDENGVVNAESPVDDSPNQGELAQRVEIRLSVRYPDGDTVCVYGGDEYVLLSGFTAWNRTLGDGLAAGEGATLLFDWRLSEEATNVVQSDTARIDVVFALRSTNETAGG